MATKSVLKSVDIKTRKSAAALINALENAKDKGCQPVVRQRTFSNASREELHKMFEGAK